MKNKIDVWEAKVWGSTRCNEHNAQYSRHELVTKQDHHCSVHYHNYRRNVFLVTKGILKVVWAHAWQMRGIILNQGSRFEIGAGIPHQFQCITDCELIEEYFPDYGANVDLDDIHRLTIGGKRLYGEQPYQASHRFFVEEGHPIDIRMYISPGFG